MTETAGGLAGDARVQPRPLRRARRSRRLLGHLAHPARRRRGRPRSAGSPSCRCSPRPSGTSSSSAGTTPAAERAAGRSACTSCSRAQARAHARGRRPSSARDERSTYARARPARRAAWPARLRRAGRRPGRAGRRAAWSARSSWSSRCSASLKAGGAYVPLDPDYPRRAPRPSCWRTPACRCSSPRSGSCRPSRRRCRTSSCLDSGLAGRRRAGRRARRAASRPEPRLRHLHLGLDRPAQGGDDPAPRHRQPPALDAGGLRADRRRPGAPEDAVQLRRLGLGVLLAAARRRAAGRGAARRPPGPAPTWPS